MNKYTRTDSYIYVSTLRLLLLAGTNFSVLVVCCIWQVLILIFLKMISY